MAIRPHGAATDQVRSDKRRCTRLNMTSKRLSRQGRVGQVGINVIEKVTLAMGSKWSPNASNDVGIDGQIEFFDPRSGRAVGYMVGVQSKVNSGRLPGETDTTFEWAVKEVDLVYWLSLNLPVLLIVIRPPQEAYWIPIREAYGSGASRRSRRVTVMKAQQAFTAEAAERILTAIAPVSVAVTVRPQRIETVVSNLLPVSMPGRLWVGDTPFATGRELNRELRDRECRDGAWLIHGGRVVTFHDLRDEPWASLIDQGTVDDFGTEEWVHSDDPDRRRVSVWLLNEAIRSHLAPEVRYWKDQHAYAFRAGRSTLVPGELADWKITDPSTGRKRTVFSSWRAKKDNHRVAYRHLAADLSFLRLEDTWYLAIVPTYIYTSDGWKTSRFQSAGTAAMKRLAHNETVRGETRFWTNYLLRESSLLHPTDLLVFKPPIEFTVDDGVDDEAWLRRNPVDAAMDTLWSDEGVQ